MTAPKSQLAFQLKTLFMGSDGTIPESYARTVDKKQLAVWIKEGLIEHRRQGRRRPRQNGRDKTLRNARRQNRR